MGFGLSYLSPPQRNNGFKGPNFLHLFNSCVPYPFYASLIPHIPKFFSYSTYKVFQVPQFSSFTRWKLEGGSCGGRWASLVKGGEPEVGRVSCRGRSRQFT